MGSLLIRIFVTLIAIVLSLANSAAYGDLRDWKQNNYELSQEESLDVEWFKKLQLGGYIVHFRHAQREQWPDVTAFDAFEIVKGINARESSFSAATCLTKQGIEEAKLMGELFKMTNVRFSTVYTSPSCRAQETARYAFGPKFTIDNSLVHRSAIPRRQHAAFDLQLRNLLLNIKINPKKNVALVGHNSTLTYLDLNSIFDLQNTSMLNLPSVEPTGFTIIENQDGRLVPRHVFKSIRAFAFASLEIPFYSKK